METPQNSASHDNKLLGILAYLGPLVIISYITKKDDPFVKFHIKQGLVLFVIEIVVWFLGSMFWSFWMFLNIVNFTTLVLAIIGIVNVIHGQEKELPVVGRYSSLFPI